MISVFGSLISTTNISINILKLKKYILDLSRNKDTDHFSNQGGWQGALDLTHPSLIDLKKEILIHTQEYLKSLDFKQGLFYSFKSMWANVNNYRDFNISHHHGAFPVAGVFYIQTPLNCGQLVFEHPSPLTDVAWKSRWLAKLTNLNAPAFRLPAQKGLLCLFPGWLIHHVEANYSKTPRISISLNIGINDRK